MPCSPHKPLWIEEPTNCDDIVGHRAIAEALAPYGVGVATGEVAQNKVISGFGPALPLQKDRHRTC